MISQLRGDYWDETMVSCYINMSYNNYIDTEGFFDYVYMMCGYSI